MKTFRTKDIMRVDFSAGLSDSDGNPIPNTPTQAMSVLYNTNVISTYDVENLIASGAHEYDERVIAITTRQAENFATKHPNARLVDIIRNMDDDSLSRFIVNLAKSPDPLETLPNLIQNTLNSKTDTLTPEEQHVQNILQTTGE